jgi:hypothetical protein
MSIAGNLPTPYRLAADEEDRCALRVAISASLWAEARRTKGKLDRVGARMRVAACLQVLDERLAAYDAASAATKACSEAPAKKPTGEGDPS